MLVVAEGTSKDCQQSTATPAIGFKCMSGYLFGSVDAKSFHRQLFWIYFSESAKTEM